MRYLGLLENVRVRRAGFAYRITYKRFLQRYVFTFMMFTLFTFYRYKLLSKQTWPNPRHGSEKDNCTLILRENALIDDCVHGKTKVFIRSPQTVFRLEELRTARIPYVIVFLQKVFYSDSAKSSTDSVLDDAWYVGSSSIQTHQSRLYDHEYVE